MTTILNLRIALVIDDLIQQGGQELLFTKVAEVFFDAPIYTIYASKYWKTFYESKHHKVNTSFIQKIPFYEKFFLYLSPFLFNQLAFESFNFKDYDIVISVSSRFSHLVITRPETLHICYMNSPARMFWEKEDYFKKVNFGILNYLKPFVLNVLEFPFKYMREIDYISSQRVTAFFANSQNIKKKIKKYLGRESTVIYPFFKSPLEETFTESAVTLPFKSKEYYLLLGRLAPWKRFDLAVDACSKLNLPLIVAGEGPDLKHLKKRAPGKTVIFLGKVDDKTKWHLLSNCKALIHPQREDFGITPLEANSVGTPVIAFKGGGITETQNKLTCAFFDKQESHSLQEVLKLFDTFNFSRNDLINNTKNYTEETFKMLFYKNITDLWENYKV